MHVTVIQGFSHPTFYMLITDFRRHYLYFPWGSDKVILFSKKKLKIQTWELGDQKFKLVLRHIVSLRLNPTAWTTRLHINLTNYSLFAYCYYFSQDLHH